MYHHGHRVEGQWVFGAIEQDSRKCFILTVEDPLLPIIKEWIAPGTLVLLFQITSIPMLTYKCINSLTKPSTIQKNL